MRESWKNKKPRKVEMRGIDPRTSRMLSERSTIWATSPPVDGDPKQKSRLEKNPTLMRKLERQPLLYFTIITVILFVSVPKIPIFYGTDMSWCTSNHWYKPRLGGCGLFLVAENNINAVQTNVTANILSFLIIPILSK